MFKNERIKIILKKNMMTKKKSDFVYLISKEIAHREIEGQVLLLRHDDNFLYTVNGSGRFIWLDLLRKKPISAITRNFAKRFSLSEEKAAQDVLKFIRHLESKKFIVKERKG
jgi:hypothetical protein